MLSCQGAEHPAPTRTARQRELVGPRRGGPRQGLPAAPAREGGPPAGAHPGQQEVTGSGEAAAAGGGALQAGGGGAESPQLPEPGSQSEVRCQKKEHKSLEAVSAHAFDAPQPSRLAFSFHLLRFGFSCQQVAAAGEEERPAQAAAGGHAHHHLPSFPAEEVSRTLLLSC